MEGVLRIEESNIVLKVKTNFDPSRLNLNEWDKYLDCLCGNREYQKEAIKAAVIYMASGEYESINHLAKENYATNNALQQKYSKEIDLINSIQLPNKLSGVIDLATGTGKSFVLYGIAQIMLAIGLVKRVLLLCPSVTIERELRKKFVLLASRADLKEYIPSWCVIKNPRIIDANVTIKSGDICIENIHAVYENTGSSINDSFINGGSDTLVLNDEIHHAYNVSSDKDIKKWKQFLLGKNNFKYIIGTTGTAYIENDYFTDVIYRYSLRKAIDDGVVKMVEYVAKDEGLDQNAKFQKIYDNHEEFCRIYSSIKPITLIVGKDIKSVSNLCEDFIEFLMKKEKIEKEVAEKKAIVVTSASKHKKNLALLCKVDEKENKVQWIFSVSMLTEGWDVKNVFQIVPWEDRAFNSKLLIAQVLGRGLRVPAGLNSQPKVRVYNHASWSKNIQSLVDEILEMELTLTSDISNSDERKKYNFVVHSIDYTKEERTTKKTARTTQEIFDLTNGMKLVSQAEEETQETEYENIRGSIVSKTTTVKKEMVTVDEVVGKISESFKGRALEAKLIFESGEYEKEKLPPISEIKNFIEKSMQECGIQGNELTIENANKIYGKFSGLLRRKPATPVFNKRVNDIIEIQTNSMRALTERYSRIKQYITMFFSSSYASDMDEIKRETLENVRDEIVGKQVKEVNKYNYKTPVDIVFTVQEPERKFVSYLISDEVSQKIDAWIKARDIGFYSIDYQKNKGAAFKGFNPDFFIKIGTNILVVETKADGDISEENCAKYKAGKRHFELLNAELEKSDIEEKYYFNFLCPSDYTAYFQYIKDGRIFSSNFHGILEDELEKEENNRYS